MPFSVSGPGDIPAPAATWPRGVDYAWAIPKPAPSCLLAAGAKFIMRYFSDDPSKDLTQMELDAALAAGLSVGVVWETTANRMLSGHLGGVADATTANNRAARFGIPGIPLYFACDWDATEAEQSAINAYMDGVSSVIGPARAGMYAGYYPLKRAFDAGKVTYGWQTTAWSGGQWDPRAQLRQVQNGVTICGTSCDWDEAMAEDFGQTPRPAAAVPITAPPGNWLDGVFTGRGTDGRLFVATWDGRQWIRTYWPVPTAT